jgi:(E)-4-hydroxy-3-methylbut-2-enyl-diphosphate synthase
LYKSRRIKIGNCELGGDAPVRVQSMTNTDTLNTEATVEQCIRIIREGADLVRLTVRNIREAENLGNIKKALRIRGYETPLIADVHFNPKIAEISAGIVEKVRINPGNFGGNDFQDKFISFLRICNKNNTAIRIGVNHGSLSDRIMDKFGDTPEGIVESAMEYLRICINENFFNVVVSVKSSNTRVMIWATRLLVKTMLNERMNFPVHLGITEAGEGEDGRIRSAVGIGTLLGEGIGDTIRVSLTEDPEEEIPVARKIVSIFEKFRLNPGLVPEWGESGVSAIKTARVMNIGNGQLPVVISSGDPSAKTPEKNKEEIEYINNESFPDYIVTDSGIFEIKPSGEKRLITDLEFIPMPDRETDILKMSDYLKVPDSSKKKGRSVFIIRHEPGDNLSLFNLIKLYKHSGTELPLIIRAEYTDPDPELFLLKASSELGRLFIDRQADGIWLENPNLKIPEISRISFGVLQAARARMSKAEYISCPSCGRTLFDIRDTLLKVKAATSHLKHLKIAVMGCIVNGPGEMADADYGFVGSTPGMVTLYKQKKSMKKNIPSNIAINELVRLIKDCGDWTEP